MCRPASTWSRNGSRAIEASRIETNVSLLGFRCFACGLRLLHECALSVGNSGHFDTLEETQDRPMIETLLVSGISFLLAIQAISRPAVFCVCTLGPPGATECGHLPLVADSSSIRMRCFISSGTEAFLFSR
jgi:hypothetical protein